MILILTVAVSAVLNYYSTRQAVLDMEKTQAEGCARVISGMLNHYGEGAQVLRSDRTGLPVQKTGGFALHQLPG